MVMNTCLFLLLFFFHFSHLMVLDLECKQIRMFTKGHNKRRLKLAKGEVPGQPAASEMKTMRWDEELAVKAAKWSSEHMIKHNPDKTVDSGRFETGENIYWTASIDMNSKLDINDVLDSWFNEYVDFKYGPVTSGSSSGRVTGHYTQMAWSNSIYVGCGVSRYKNDDEFLNYLVVCNYGPAGNILGERPYKSGPPSKRLDCVAKSCVKPYGDKCRKRQKHK